MVYDARTETRVDVEKQVPDNFIIFGEKTETSPNSHVPVSPKSLESFGTNVVLQKYIGTTTSAYGIWNPNFICGYREIVTGRKNDLNPLMTPLLTRDFCKKINKKVQMPSILWAAARAVIDRNLTGRGAES